jgi:hypothetical protein
MQHYTVGIGAMKKADSHGNIYFRTEKKEARFRASFFTSRPSD